MSNCSDNDSAGKKLSALSWEFAHENTRNLTHGYHPFHGKFIPQIPRAIITHLTEPDDMILDPFCGSGTSLVEANVLGRGAIGADISPIAILISQVKTTYIDPMQIEFELSRLHDMIISKKQAAVIPHFPDQEIWYNEKTLQELGNIWGQILFYKNRNKRLFCFFQVAFSSILKTVANRSHHWNWAFIGDNLLPKIDKYVDPHRYFFRAIKQMANGMKEFSHAKTNSSVEVMQLDARGLSNHLRRSINLIITSPPYCFAVDFNRYYRLSYYWFGWEIQKHWDVEIGARSKRSKKDAVNIYFSDIEKSIEEFHKVLTPGGYLCFTLGNTKRNYETIASVDRSTEIALQKGFKLLNNIDREISKQSMPQKRISKESVLIFQKQH